MNLEQRILFIKQNLLDKGGYSIAAKECLGIIEFALRELLLRHLNVLDIETQRKIIEAEKKEAKNGRGKSIQYFTMGQLLRIIRETDFFNAWAKATNKDLINIRMINLDALSKLRNELFHLGKKADSSEAHFLFYSLQLIIESFGIENLEQASLTDLSNLLHLIDFTNPYRGLAAFREQDSEYFFGRTEEIEDLQQLILERNFVAVIGNSGSGKSSLVFAGLLPKIRQTQGWLIATCRPQVDPFYQIAKTLVDTLYQIEPNEIARWNEIKTLADHFKNQTLEIDQIVQRILQKYHSDYILLVIDQFEELYTLNSSAIQQRFIDFLLTKPSNLTLLITLKADFLGYVLNHPNFAKYFGTYQNKMLSNLGIQNLRQAIEEPALKLSTQFENGLIERIIQDVGIQTGSLPLLQFTLQQLWEKREQNKLTHLAYEALGTVTQALTNYADEVYKRLSEEGQQQLRYLFVQMVRPGEGTEDTRQVAFLKHLNAAQREIIKQLADTRLVVTSRIEQTGEETVEVAHEALIHHWQPLREWMTEDRSFRIWQEELRYNIRIWIRSKHETESLLRGHQLQKAIGNLDIYQDMICQQEKDFIEESIKQHLIEEKIKQQQVIFSTLTHEQKNEFKQLNLRINKIKKSQINKGNYSVAARELVLTIESALRILLSYCLTNTINVDKSTLSKIKSEEKKMSKNGKGKNVHDFTMGQLVGIINSTKLFEVLEKSLNKDLYTIRLINFPELTALRNKLTHSPNMNVGKATVLILFEYAQKIIRPFYSDYEKKISYKKLFII